MQQKATFESTVLDAIVTITVTVDSPAPVNGEAMSRIHEVLTREVGRFAEIAGVNLRDQEFARQDAARLRALPKERPMTIVAVGSKDPASVQQFFGDKELADADPAKVAAFPPNPGPEKPPSGRKPHEMGGR